MTKKELSNKQLFTLILYAVFLPLLTLTFSQTPAIFFTIHMVASISLLCVFSLLILKHRLNKNARFFIPMLAVIYPSLVFSAYPFSLHSFVLVLTLVISGLLVPIFSIKATWWFYTLGGRFPLPSDAKWLGRNTGNYESFVNSSMSNVLILLPVMLIFLQLSRMFGVSDVAQSDMVALVLGVLSSITVFGLSLTFGMHIRKRREGI